MLAEYPVREAMPPPNRPIESKRRWLSGLAVTVATIVSYMAFWRLAPGVVFVVGCVAFVGLVVAAWVLGKNDVPIPPKGR